MQRGLASESGLVVVKSLAAAIRLRSSPLALDLASSEDLQCRNLLCEKVGEACICRLSHVLETLKDVRRLDLAGNALTALPGSVWQLQNLSHLNLSRNLLMSIPRDIACLKSLEVLQLDGNEALADLPPELEHMQLRKLELPQHLRMGHGQTS